MAEVAPIFSTYSFVAARDLARTTGKLLLVDVMAHWCPPCRMMDDTTWRDAALIAWVKEHAIAIQIDAEGDRATAGHLNVRAFPTVVALLGDVEVARAVGYRSGEAMLDWLIFLATGEAPSLRLSKSIDCAHDMPGRLKLARAYFEEGHLDAALAEYAWLWGNAASIDASMAATRATIFRRHLEQLVSSHPPARERFAAYRDAAENTSRLDWLILNDVLHESRRTFDWFQKVKTDATLTSLFQTCAIRLVPLLIDRGLWDDIHFLYPDAPDELAKAAHLLDDTGAEPESETAPGELRARRLPAFRDTARILYGSLVAQKKEKDAASLRDAILKIDDTPATRALLQKASHAAKWS